MYKRIVSLFFLSTLIFVNTLLACTTAIVSGKYTKDGRPILWKHRDTGHLQNIIHYFDDGKYNYLALVNADDLERSQIWVGYNSTGFAIMNAASYNLKSLSDSSKIADREGILMKQALMHCSSLQDFETMLDTMQKPLGVESNFGCIDAKGGAAYYETNNYKYHKFDVNDPAIAPFGYIVKTNYSHFGRADDGYGYIRYMAAEELFYYGAAKHTLTPEYIIREGSRNLRHALTKRNLKKEATNEDEKMVILQDFIPRHSTSASIAIQGVKENEDPTLSTMWTCLGWPLTSVTTPIWLAGGKNLPKFLTPSENGYAKMCKKGMKLKKLAFPIERGSGDKYMNINFLYRPNNNGITQKILSLENTIFEKTRTKLQQWYHSKDVEKEIENYYLWLEKFLGENYFNL